MSTESWHLRKELSIGTIVSLLILVIGSVGAFVRVEASLEHKAEKTDVAVVQSQAADLKDAIKRIEEMQAEILREQRELARDIRKN